jgi:hypothetical protein
MREEQRLFLVQAKSAFKVYKLLSADNLLHHCHALHYLQMATELLGKANAWRNGPIKKKSHKALVKFLRSLSSNTKAQTQLGYEGQNEHWVNTIRKFTPLAESLQQLAPHLAGDGPNPEYPWPAPPGTPTATPVEYEFPIWSELTDTAHGRNMISLFDYLFAVAEEFM